MRLGHGLWLVGIALALPAPACSGGYPLPPTACDEWCDATKGGMCEDDYKPATCVVECERTGVDLEQCRPALDAVISCFRNSPNEVQQRCLYRGSIDYVGVDDQPACQAESGLLGACALQQNQKQ